MKRADLPDILYEILRDLNGRAPMMIVFRYFWNKYGKTLCFILGIMISDGRQRNFGKKIV